MFCKNCGNEVKENEEYCSKCGKKINEKETKKIGMSKKIKLVIIISVIIVATILGIVIYYFFNNKETNKTTIETKGTMIEETNINLVAKNKDSTPTEDKDLGLKSVKIDNLSVELTEKQKVVLQYFDNDYIKIDNYEFLMRYPQIYEDSQIKAHGKVLKIIKSDNDNYELVVWVGDSQQYYEYWTNYKYGIDTSYNEYLQKNINNYIVIKGKQTETRLIEGDWITIYGRYESINNYTIDTVSYTIPTINVYSIAHDINIAKEGSLDGIPNKFDYSFIKKVAKAIFNDNVTVRDATDDEAVTGSSSFINNPAYVCELDNQSNAKFSKYFFSCDNGRITDANNYSQYPVSKQAGISRNIEFAPDFEHFFLFIYDENHKVLTLEYYDKDFKKIWSKEFEETERATYDYTENNIYLVANGYLYIINTNTGEDSFEKRYVGPKVNIRKLKDSILLFEAGRTETVMKTDLKGNIFWTANVKNENGNFEMQIKENTLVTTGYDTDMFYSVIDLETGKIKLNAKSLSTE